MSEYADLFTGRLTRWETAGALLAAFALSKPNRDLSKRNALEELSKPPSWKATVDLTNVCLGFCDDSGSINDIILWILKENFVVQTLLYGDASYPAWKRVGDISSCLFALGLHQQIKVTPEVPRWLAELRKHNLMFAYSIDKSMAVFVGRPPRINRRYIRLDIPMCLAEDELALPPAELEDLIAQRGGAIWNPDNIETFLGSYAANINANKNTFVMREEVSSSLVHHVWMSQIHRSTSFILTCLL